MAWLRLEDVPVRASATATVSLGTRWHTRNHRWGALDVTSALVLAVCAIVRLQSLPPPIVQRNQYDTAGLVPAPPTTPGVKAVQVIIPLMFIPVRIPAATQHSYTTDCIACRHWYHLWR